MLLDGDAGAVKVTLGEAVSTMNVTGALTPAGLPAELVWVAVAVYTPLASAGLASPDVQLPAVADAVAVARTVPVAVGPA